MAGLNDISVANFTVLDVLQDDNTTYDQLESVSSIGELTDEKTVIDVTEYGAEYLRKLIGTASAGPLEVVVNTNPDTTAAPQQARMLALYKSGARNKFRIVMNANSTGTDGDFIEFTGLVASKSQSNEFDAARTTTFSIAIDGALGDSTPVT